MKEVLTLLDSIYTTKVKEIKYGVSNYEYEWMGVQTLQIFL